MKYIVTFAMNEHDDIELTMPEMRLETGDYFDIEELEIEGGSAHKSLRISSIKYLFSPCKGKKGQTHEITAVIRVEPLKEYMPL
jgi:hypothetical protein